MRRRAPTVSATTASVRRARSTVASRTTSLDTVGLIQNCFRVCTIILNIKKCIFHNEICKLVTGATF